MTGARSGDVTAGEPTAGALIRPPARRSAVDPFIVMDVMRAAAAREEAGHRVAHMEVGQPGTPAPKGAIAAAKHALETDRLGYSPALGLPSLRRRIARHYAEFYGVEVAPERIIVTTGSSGGFVLAFLTLFDAGERVALAAPGYPCYRTILRALGVEPVILETAMEERFQPTPARLEAVPGALAGLIVASPGNPTGTMVDADALDRLAAHCRKRRMMLVSDEIYHGVTFGMRPATAAAYENAVVVNSFSKFFSMTGWRVGWLVVPPALVRTVERLAQNLFISAPALSQIAAEAAFACQDELEGNVARYARNRAVLLDALPKAGFDRLAPADGAFYIYADIGRLAADSAAFCVRMLEEAGVAATPGIDFDPARGHRYVRFSFAESEAEVARAARQLIAWRRAITSSS